MKLAIAVNQRPGDRMTKRFSGLTLGLFILGTTASHAAAAYSPSIDLLGSYFPAWLLCIVVGVMLTVIARLLFVAWKLDAHMFPGPIIYPCLTAIFAMVTWLIFFRN